MALASPHPTGPAPQAGSTSPPSGEGTHIGRPTLQAGRGRPAGPQTALDSPHPTGPAPRAGSTSPPSGEGTHIGRPTLTSPLSGEGTSRPDRKRRLSPPTRPGPLRGPGRPPRQAGRELTSAALP